MLIPLPNDKILELSKFKAYADDKINATRSLNFVLGGVKNILGKRRKCWLPAFSPFPKMFSKALQKVSSSRVVKLGLCGKGLTLFQMKNFRLSKTERVFRR